MTEEIEAGEKKNKEVEVKVQGGSSGAVYGIGIFGAWIYFIGRAKTPREGVIGFFKGFAWPAILVYELLEFLNKDKPVE